MIGLSAWGLVMLCPATVGRVTFTMAVLSSSVADLSRARSVRHRPSDRLRGKVAVTRTALPGRYRRPSEGSRKHRSPDDRAVTNLPMFSVLIPAYQAADTIADAIDSALVQTHPPVEIIVCDDGSTDATPTILSGYGQAITVVSQENRGLSAARNAALAQAKGDYVVLLDADDRCHPRRLEAIAHAAVSTRAEIITTDATIIDESGVECGTYYSGREFPHARDQRLAILRNNFVFVGAAILRSALVEIGGFNASAPWPGEYEAWVRLVLAGRTVHLVREPLYYYQHRSASLSTNYAYNRGAAIGALENAVASGMLSGHERRVAEARLRQLIAAQRTADAASALGSGRSGRRLAALRVVATPGTRPSLRLKFLVAALLPDAAADRFATQHNEEVGRHPSSPDEECTS